MHNYSLNLIIASSVFGSLLLIGIFNILFILRKRFPVRVNCWFCNSNLRVPYNDYNSFTCVVCQQYNGFDKYGNYNQEISAQHYSKNNPNTYCQNVGIRKPPACNGFCEFCSRNQELKVLQLANFRARCEDKYDEEIEEFRQKLEDSYQLCSQCQRHLNRTLNRVKTKFIGSRIAQLKEKSLNALNQTTKIITKDGRFISTLIILTILILSIVNFKRDMNIEVPPTDLSDSMLAIYNHFNAFLFTLGDIAMTQMKTWELNEWIKDISFDNVAASALLLNIVLIMWDRKKIRAQIVISMIAWSAKMVSNEVVIYESYTKTVKGTIATILVVSSLSILIKLWRSKGNSSKNQNTSFHKITNDAFEDSDNDCDVSDSVSFYDWQSSRTISYPKPQNSKLNASLCSRTFSRDMKNRLNKSSPKSIDLLSNKSFSIIKEVNSADRKQIQNDITRLKLTEHTHDKAFSTSSTIADFNSTLNPFSLEKNQRASPTLSVASIFTSASHRNVISPPRLHSPQVYTSDNTQSWVAGGYWTSPQKNYIESIVNPKPVMSRSSSQSSGLGTMESEKNSRENSLAQEEIAKSIFFDKSNVHNTNLFHKPAVRSLFENSLFPSNRSIMGESSFYSNYNYGNNSFNKYRDPNTFLKYKNN